MKPFKNYFKNLFEKTIVLTKQCTYLNVINYSNDPKVKFFLEHILGMVLLIFIELFNVGCYL